MIYVSVSHWGLFPVEFKPQHEPEVVRAKIKQFEKGIFTNPEPKRGRILDLFK